MLLYLGLQTHILVYTIELSKFTTDQQIYNFTVTPRIEPSSPCDSRQESPAGSLQELRSFIQTNFSFPTSSSSEGFKIQFYPNTGSIKKCCKFVRVVKKMQN